MSWIPRFRVLGTCLCFDWGEAEGAMLQIEWRCWIVELALSRRVREVADAR